MRQSPTILKTELLAQSSHFQIEALHLRFSNGQHRVYERLRGTGYRSVLLVAMPDPQHVLMVREYAVGSKAPSSACPRAVPIPVRAIWRRRSVSWVRKSACGPVG